MVCDATVLTPMLNLPFNLAPRIIWTNLLCFEGCRIINGIILFTLDRHNPEILMKRDERQRRPSPPARHASPRRDRSPSPRHFPSADRNFSQSIREERRVTGGYNRGPDPYDLNNYSRQYDDDDDYGRYAPRGEPRRMRNLEQKLGYLP